MGAYGQAPLGMSYPGSMQGMMYPAGADMAGYGSYMGGMMMPNSWFPSANSAAAFHIQGPKNEIKLFVGGLQF
jgi:hypothetical protein